MQCLLLIKIRKQRIAMLKIIKDSCSNCYSNAFQFVKKENGGNRICCLSGGAQKITNNMQVVYDENLLIDRKLIEKSAHEFAQLLKLRYRQGKEQQKGKQQRKESKDVVINKDKDNALKKLFKWFQDDFLSSKQVWRTELSMWLSEAEFNEVATKFVIDWFKTQGWTVPDQEQAQCIAEVWDHVQVVARAGSGKTATAVNRAAFLVRHCNVAPSKILLLAFNREAAEEVQKRLHELLGEEAPQAMTFHALAYAIVHPEEALIYDDEISGFKKSSTVQQVIDSFIRHPVMSEKIQEFMLKYFRTEWEAITSKGHQMKPEEMVEYRRSLPCVGLDGRNYKSTGEKRIADYFFERNIPYSYEKNFWWEGLNYKPDFTIHLTHQKRKGIVIEYYGMAGNKEYDKQTVQKRNFWKEQSDYYYTELYPDQVTSSEAIDHCLGLLLQDHHINTQKMTEFEIWHQLKNRAVDEFSMMVSGFIGRCRKLLISPDDLVKKVNDQREALSELQIDFLRISWRIYQEYMQTLYMNDEEDFDGLVTRAARKTDSGESRWHRKAGTGNLKSVNYLFIDEYQDFSLLFYEMIAAVKKSNPELTAFCVGDDWQAINGFAGSDLRFFLDFQTYFTDAKKLTISSNYRSAQNIVRIGNQLMHRNGLLAIPVSPHPGKVQIAKMNEFTPSDFEKTKYNGDDITPLLIRLVYSFVKKGQRVALLCRKGGGVPWYTAYERRKGKFHNDFLTVIRNSLPEELRALVVSMDTTHSYKGKEEDAIILVDAVKRSFPLIHPSNVFFEILGQTLASTIEEEKRLFYVALSRAKHSLIILTEQGVESPFLIKDIQENLHIETMNLTKLEAPKGNGTHYMIKVVNASYDKQSGTYAIKSLLKEHQYQWSAADKSWIKQVAAEGFTKEQLLNESWTQQASNVRIAVSDEFHNEIVTINFPVVGKI